MLAHTQQHTKIAAEQSVDYIHALVAISRSFFVSHDCKR